MIKNITKDTVVAKRFFVKKGLSKTKGLIGEKKPKAIVLKTRFGIHTFFLNFPIDVLVLDKNKKVVFLKRDIKPNKILIWNMKFDTIVELPPGTIKASKTRKGDILDFKL